MSNIAAYAEKAMLDWVLGGATPTQPPQRYVGLSLAAPNSTAASEIGTAQGYTRQSASFGAAASPAGSASNANAMTFGPMVSAVTIAGLVVFDTVSATIGNMLWEGTVASARTLQAGDSYIIPAGSILITLS